MDILYLSFHRAFFSLNLLSNQLPEVKTKHKIPLFSKIDGWTLENDLDVANDGAAWCHAELAIP